MQPATHAGENTRTTSGSVWTIREAGPGGSVPRSALPGVIEVDPRVGGGSQFVSQAMGIAPDLGYRIPAMRTTTVAPRWLGLAMVLLSCGGEAAMPDDAPASSYRVVEGWPVVPPGVAFGRALGVAVDSRGRVYVTHTADRGANNPTPIARPTIFVFDPDSGALLAQLGAGLFRYPHGISIDRDDAIWVTDSEANRVFKLDAAGRVLLTLGKD
jgi:DNA-binding beta-propeller fold protein YncE